jgi:transcriptional regulator with XRE-family HTH domain
MILNRIKFLCEQNKISVKDLATEIGVTEAGFYGFFRNNTLKVRELEKIAEKLNVSVASFFSENETKRSKAKVHFELEHDDILKVDIKNKKIEITKGK